jgi:hypothetical protein
MPPLQGIDTLPSNMGTRNGIEEMGEIGSSLKLNNTSPCFGAITNLHPNLSSCFKLIV